jgi:glycosyltransferase involved in cell wall biosynthesis
VDPADVDDIAEAMHKISIDEQLRNKLIEKGALQRHKFSWNLTAEKLWKSIEKCINS